MSEMAVIGILCTVIIGLSAYIWRYVIGSKREKIASLEARIVTLERDLKETKNNYIDRFTGVYKALDKLKDAVGEKIDDLRKDILAEIKDLAKKVYK